MTVMRGSHLIVGLCGVVLLACSDKAKDSEDAITPDAADASDGSSADGNDGTDNLDGHDGSDGTDAADATDATDATDGTAAADAIDGTDGTDTPTEPSCEAYCKAITAHCQDENAQYKSNDACLTYCNDLAKLPLGAVGDNTGNSVGCRMFQISLVTSDPDNATAAKFCSHAGPTGDGICGTLCDNYCALATNICTGNDALFKGENACLASCATLKISGSPDDQSGDSVQCRISHLAGPAATDPPKHCADAAVNDSDVCFELTPTCTAYCELLSTNCVEQNAQYPGPEQCHAYCKVWAHLPIGKVGNAKGNSIGCRMHFAELALAGDTPQKKVINAKINCPRAGATGANKCGSWCQNYCHLAQTNCVDENALYENKDACMDACGRMPNDAPIASEQGDSVQCRIFQLGIAGSDVTAGSAKIHCPFGSQDGAGVCGEPSE